MKLHLAAAAAAVGLFAAASAQAEGLKIFKDWNAACDNVATCTAYGFQGDEYDLGYMMLARKGGAAAPRLVFAVSPGDDDGGALGDAAWTPRLDGQPITGFATLPGKDDKSGYWRTDLEGARVHAFIDAIRNGDELTLETPGGLVVARYSLSGLTATLLWFDENQDRVGTTSALLRKGSGAAPPAPAAPVIARGPEVSQDDLPAAPPKAVVAKVRGCDVDYATAEDLSVHRLSPGVLLWMVPCSRGAYNTDYHLLLADEKGGSVRNAVLPDTPGAGQDASGFLMNAVYDPKTRTLGNFDKARGIGDCGAQSEWVWTGSRFALAWQSIMPECRGVGSEEWPSLWTATVK